MSLKDGRMMMRERQVSCRTCDLVFELGCLNSGIFFLLPSVLDNDIVSEAWHYIAYEKVYIRMRTA